MTLITNESKKDGSIFSNGPLGSVLNNITGVIFIIKIQNLITKYSLPMLFDWKGSYMRYVLVVHTKNLSIMSIYERMKNCF